MCHSAVSNIQNIYFYENDSILDIVDEWSGGEVAIGEMIECKLLLSSWKNKRTLYCLLDCPYCLEFGLSKLDSVYYVSMSGSYESH